LECGQPFSIEAAFVPVVLIQELIESAFRDALDGLITGSNKTCHTGLRVMFLVMREATELIDEIGTGQKPP
jgi:hypothetical protein